MMGQGHTKKIAVVKTMVGMEQPERIAVTGRTLGIGNTSLEESSGRKGSNLRPASAFPSLQQHRES